MLITIEDCDLVALLDTASVISIISTVTMDSVEGLRGKLKTWDGCLVLAADGKELQLIGGVTTKITVAGVELEVTFAVVEDFFHPVLMGNDLIKRLKPTMIDYETFKPQGGVEIPITFRNNYEDIAKPRDFSAEVTLKEEITVPPRTTMKVNG